MCNKRQRAVEVGPGNGERNFRPRGAEPREQAVEGDDEDVPLCVSELCPWLLFPCH